MPLLRLKLSHDTACIGRALCREFLRHDRQNAQKISPHYAEMLFPVKWQEKNKNNNIEFMVNCVTIRVLYYERRGCPLSRTTLFDSRIRKYAYREAAQIYKDIGASPNGLSHEQAEAMREKFGANSFAGRNSV